MSVRGPIELNDGDRVLVRATVAGRTVKFASGRGLPLRDVEIATIEEASFQIGDRVVAQGHAGTILGIHECGNFLWIAPDDGNGRPWTVGASECHRAPAPPPSAEILEGPGRRTEAAE